MARLIPARANDRALTVLTSTIVSVAVIGALYWAQRVLIPVALALLFAFLLTPVVLQVQRWGLPRVAAVTAVTVLAGVVVLGFLGLVASQFLGLASELPKHTITIKKKIEAIHEIGQDADWLRFEAMIQELAGAVGMPKNAKADGGTAKASSPDQQVLPVVVDQSEPLWLRIVLAAFGPASEVLGQIGLIVILVVFVLLAREDLRNRFIRLVGHGRLTVTTKAVDDATQRLSRFLLMQFFINVTFGCCVAVGLTAIGVQYALLWGVLAGVLRYIPYIGSPIAALFPTLLSIAQFDSWVEPCLVMVLILALELLTANLLEPLLFGRSIGVSAVALLIAAAFWAFLWGPIGLVLSCPLTVCLVVLGKYVPNLEFLTVLLSDEPALEEDFTYYQRLTARDEDEATDIVLEYGKDHPGDEVYDALLVPALIYAGRDYQREGVDEDDLRFIRETTREILADVEAARQEQKVKAEPSVSERNASLPRDKVRFLGIPSRDESDELALQMLRQMIEDENCEMMVAGTDVLSSELVTRIESQAPAAVCIAALPPGGQTRARLLCKRLHARFPDLPLLVGRWGLGKIDDQSEKALREAGASHVRTTLIGSRNDVVAWLPALAELSAEAKAASEAAPTSSAETAGRATNGPAKARQLS